MNELCTLLRHPEAAAELDALRWDEVLVQGRGARLIGRLPSILRDVPPASIPPAVADVIRGARIMITCLQGRARFEVRRLKALTESADYPVVLLKGVAYLVADLPSAEGRALNDIDILVPESALPRAERVLLASGWRFSDGLTPYDEHYYRSWTHEPPLEHPDAHFELDVHHSLVRPTSRAWLHNDALSEAVVPIEGSPFFRLGDEDLVLHSAAHLFMTDGLRSGLRDLADIAVLCRHFAARNDEFWLSLVERASTPRMRPAPGSCAGS